MTNPNTLISLIPKLKNLPYLAFIWVEPGSFTMGSALEAKDAFGDEKPSRKVKIKQGFWMGAYPVSQAFWESIMGENPSAYKDPNRPVEQVSWDDIRDEGGFLDQLNQTLGIKNNDPYFRLPSEAEWEYAALGGKYWEEGYGYAGSDYLRSVGHFDENTEDEGSKPLGLKLPNALGLYDMSGNVWEWCEDDWHDNYSNAPKTGQPWIDSPNRGDFRVDRGGSWTVDRGIARVAYRHGSSPDGRWFDLGCRLVFA